MILVKPYQIAAGGSRYDVPGAKFFLLAASEPLNIVLYAGTQRVGEVDGMQGGLEVGPFCPALTGFSVTTQSGLAGSALIGVGEEEMGYNPLAGALNFSNPAASAAANQPAPVKSTAAQASAQQQNFAATTTVAAVAGDVAAFEISNSAYPDAKTATINRLTFSNPGAAAVNMDISILMTYIILANAVTANNLYSGGAASAFAITQGAVAASSLPAPPTLKNLKTVTVPAGGSAEVDFTVAPIILPKGVEASLLITCETANQVVTIGAEWSEA